MTIPTASATRSLSCHPATPAGMSLSISVAESITPTGLRLTYVVAGNIAALRLPCASAPSRAEGLWQHTCLEAFVATEGHGAYREFNFSPSGQWAMYDFASERMRSPETLGDSLPPALQTAVHPDRLTLIADLPWAALPARGCALRLGLSAVMEDTSGQLSYWALTHPGDQPDFHHAAGRTLRLVLPET